MEKSLVQLKGCVIVVGFSFFLKEEVNVPDCFALFVQIKPHFTQAPALSQERVFVLYRTRC